MMIKNLRFCSSLCQKFRNHKLALQSNNIAGFGASFYFCQKRKSNQYKKSHHRTIAVSTNLSFYFLSKTLIHFFKFLVIKTPCWQGFRNFFQVSNFTIPHIIWGYKYPIIANGVRSDNIEKQKGTFREIFMRVTRDRSAFLQSDFIFGFLFKWGCSL